MHYNFRTTNTILYCRKWDVTVQFYRDYLQLPVNFCTNWFVEFCLTPTSRLSIADDKHSSIKSHKTKGLTLTWEVEDIIEARNLMISSGIKPSEISRHPWGAMVFYLIDPEGHRIEIWQTELPTNVLNENNGNQYGIVERSAKFNCVVI